MSRPLRSKLLYVCCLAALAGCMVAWVVYSPYDKWLTVLAASLILLIPGRIQGAVFRDHYRGRKLMSVGEYEAAIDHFERFLLQIRKQPWKKHFIWMAWGIYSWDIEAMTLNNLGAALIDLGRFDAAKMRLDDALRVDPQYAVPHFNLAVLASVQGDEAAARQHISCAEALGYARTPVDRVVHLGQSILANLEGRGISLDRGQSGETRS